MRHVLVTGGAGFIGSNAVDALLERGAAVRVLDDLSTGRRQNLAHLGDTIELVVGDLRDAELVDRCLEGVSHVLHLAALPSVSRSVEDPLASHQVNATGTLILLEAARKAGVERLVQASSSSVYGDQDPSVAKHEEMTPRPLSPYAISKLAAESYARVHHALYGLETVSLRFFNVFGPRQSPHSEYAAVIPRFIDRLTRGQAPLVFGDGEQTRDFTYVDNTVNGCLLALERPGVAGRVFNMATGSAVSVNRLAELLGGLATKPVPPEHAEPRPGDIRHSLANMDAACQALGYVPKVDLEEGLRRTWQAFEEGP